MCKRRNRSLSRWQTGTLEPVEALQTSVRGIQSWSRCRKTQAPGQTPRRPSRAKALRSCSECLLEFSWTVSFLRSIQDHSSTSAAPAQASGLQHTEVTRVPMYCQLRLKL